MSTNDQFIFRHDFTITKGIFHTNRNYFQLIMVIKYYKLIYKDIYLNKLK